MPVGRGYRRARIVVFAGVLLASALALLIAPNRAFPELFALLSRYLLLHQDLPVVPLLLLPLAVRPKQGVPPTIDRPMRVLVAPLGAVGIALLGWAGHYLVFAGHDLSRDEQMANFDARIFAHGHLYWPIPPFWRTFADALNQLFMIPIGDHEAWLSSYLPINAASRGLVGLIVDPALTSPLLAAIGALALWRIARRLWPDEGRVQAVVLALYVGSSQMLVAGMTAYAMSAHLALNLVWLALFLRANRWAHAGAIMVGFLAVGIHQPLFHPLFVLPFLDLLFRQKKWRLLAAYISSYALIGLFWLAWPVWISAHGVGPVPPVPNPEGVNYAQRLVAGLQPFTLDSLWLMAANLLRFFTWQHIMLLPLLALGVGTGWKSDPLVRALLMGMLFTLGVMLVLLPYQGHGWGYRYLHGFIGSACLLGGYGWRWLEQRGASLRTPITVATIASLGVLLPIHMAMARHLVMPFHDVSRTITNTQASVVIVDDAAVPFGQDVVINRADLTNRPLLLLGSKLAPRDIGRLCVGRSLAFANAPMLAPISEVFGLGRPPTASDPQAALQAAAVRAGCTIVPLGA